MLGLSGIVSIVFNGLAHATYTKPNLSEWSIIVLFNFKIRQLKQVMKEFLQFLKQWFLFF